MSGKPYNAMNPFKIQFVCLGNICRSPLAHAVFQFKVDEANLTHLFHIESSGTGAWHVGELADHRMRQEAATHHIDMNHRARKFSYCDLSDYDLILAMDKHNYADILQFSNKSEDLKKVKLFRFYDPKGHNEEVPDPYYGDKGGFGLVFEIIQRTSDVLLKKLMVELQ